MRKYLNYKKYEDYKFRKATLYGETVTYFDELKGVFRKKEPIAYTIYFIYYKEKMIDTAFTLRQAKARML